MARLSQPLPGPFEAALHSEPSEPIEAFESNKARALLTYLAAESNPAHARSSLASLFWPDRSGHITRTDLRSALSKLRQVIGDRDTPRPALASTRDMVQFDTGGDC